MGHQITSLFVAILLVGLIHASGAAPCKPQDISISQGQVDPTGIPVYSVIIANVCPSGCSISNIHLNCGMFASARQVNPKIFKRIADNDCLVNDGRPLAAGLTISFTYANTFKYPLSLKSADCA